MLVAFLVELEIDGCRGIDTCNVPCNDYVNDNLMTPDFGVEVQLT